jgi:hypothetical protein
MTYNEFQECERCNNEAQTLLEHAQHAEAVCFACRDDESREEEAKKSPMNEWWAKNMEPEEVD